MSRFNKFTARLLSFGLVVGLAGAVGQAEEAAIRDIGSRRELFVDHYLIDRLVQQAILQVLEPLLDPTFSPSSYGFRPGRSAHDALRQASRYVAQRRRIVVDMDLEKFFDRVNHDILMARLARRESGCWPR